MLGTVIAVAMLGAIVVEAFSGSNVSEMLFLTQWVDLDRYRRQGDRRSHLRYSDLAVAATASHGPRVSAVLDGGGAVAVVLPNQVIVEPFDLLPTTLDIPRGHRVSALPTANDLSVVIGDDSGGNLAIVTDVAGLRPVVMDLGVFTANRILGTSQPTSVTIPRGRCSLSPTLSTFKPCLSPRHQRHPCIYPTLHSPSILSWW